MCDLSNVDLRLDRFEVTECSLVSDRSGEGELAHNPIDRSRVSWIRLGSVAGGSMDASRKGRRREKRARPIAPAIVRNR